MTAKPISSATGLLFLLACFAPPALAAQAGTSDQIAAFSPEAYEKLLSDSVADEPGRAALRRFELA